VEPNARALRYYKLLSAKPSSDYVYDRFYDAWLDTGTLPEMQDFLRAGLQEAPTVAHHLLLSFYYERQGEDAKALQLYEEALAREPENADLYYLKAKAELRLNDIDGAIKDLHRIEGLKVTQSLRIKSGKFLAKLYSRTLDAEKARQTWQSLLKTYPEDEDLYEELIELQLTEGLYDDALQTSAALLAQTQDNYQRVMRQLRRGDIYQYQTKKGEALKVYSSTLAWVEQGSWLENQICAQIEQVFRREDDLTGLKEYWESLAKTYPQRISLKKRRAAALLQVGESGEALALYREILRVTPGDRTNEQAYIEALVKADQLERAIELLIQLRQRNHSDGELLIRLASLYDQNNDPNATGRVLEEYLQQSEKTEYSYMRVARLLERYQLRRQALAVYQESVETSPDSHTAQEAYADALYRHDHQDRALQIWHQLAQTDDLSLLLRLSQTVAIRGRHALALEWLENRYGQYHTDIVYMNRLCALALQCKAYDKAVLWTQNQLGLAQRFSQIQHAIQHIITLCQDTDTFSDWTERAANMPAPSVQQVCLHAALLARSRQFDQAHQVLDTVQGSARNLALQQEIRLYQHQRRWEEAAQHTQELINLTGTNKAAHLRDLVDLYQRAGRLDQALQWIPVWKKSAPGNPAVWLTQAALLEKQGQRVDAINCLRRAHTSFDGDVTVLQQLALLYRAHERHAEAQRVYWRLYEQADDMTDKLRWVRELATTARALSQETALIETFQQRRRSNRSSVVPCLALAEIYRQIGQYEERRQALLEATRLRPKDIGLLHEIARIEESEGDWQRALDTLEQATSLDRTEKTRQKMARLHIEYGNEQDGYRILFDLAQAQLIDPRNAESLVNSMVTARDWAMALEFLEGLLPQHPEDYRLHYLYALALEEEGHEDRAVQQFLGLLDMQKELVTGKSTPARTSAQQQYQSYFTIVPESVREWMMIRNAYTRAYPRQGSMRYQSYSSRQQAIQLPATVDECRRFALVHLIVLAEGREARREQIQRRLSARGIADAETLLHLAPQDRQQNSQELIALADRFPRHQTVLGLLAFYGISEQIAATTHTRDAYHLLAAEYPLFAALIGLSHGAQDAENADILASSVATLLSQDKADAYTFDAVTGILRKPNTQLTDGHERQLKAKLRDWYARADQNLTYKPRMFQRWLSVLATDDNKRELVQVLDREIQGLRQARGHTPQSRSWLQRSYESVIQPLAHTPAQVLDLPDHIVDLLTPGQNLYGPQQDAAFEPNELKPHLQEINDPVLRSVLAVIADEDKRAEQDLQQYLDTHPDDQAARVLLASIWARQQRESDVIALLHEVTCTPWAKSRRMLLDGAIVYYGLDLDADEHATAVDLARQAALRLCGQPLNQSQQENLVRALSALGLDDQADRLVLRSASTQQSRQQMSAMRNRYNAPQVTQIEALLEKGKTDTALRLALRSLELNLGRSRFPGSFGQQREVTDLAVHLQAHRLVDRLLEMAHPGQSHNLKRRLFYAQLCQLFSRPQQASTIYAGILQRRPRDPIVNLYMASTLMKHDPNEALAHLLAIRQRDQDLIGQFLMESCEWNPRNIEQVKTILETGRLATSYLQHLADPNYTNLQWADQMRARLSSSMGLGHEQLRGLYQPARQSNDLDEQSLRLQKQRRSTHNRLCRMMLSIPQLAGQGFTGLHAEARARRALTDEFADLAYQAWCLTQTYQSRWGISASRHSWGNGRSNRTVHALEYLLFQAWHQGALPERVHRLKAAVPSKRRAPVAQQIDALARLYLVSADEFAETADTFLNQWESAGQTLMSFAVNDPDTRLGWVMDAYTDRSLDTDLDALILKAIRRQRSGYGNQVRQIVCAYLSARVPQHRAQANQLLEKIVLELLGPKAQRQALIDRHYQRHRMQANAVNQRIHLCLDLIRSLAQEEALFWSVLGQLDGLVLPENNLRYTVENRIQNSVHGDPNEFFTFLESSPFLGDLTDFNPLALHDLDDGSAYATLVNKLATGTRRGRQRDTAAREDKLVSALDAYPSNFGVEFLKAHLAQDRYQAVFQCLGRYWPEFQELDQTRQRQISQVLTHTLANQDGKRDDLPESARVAHVWFKSTQSESVDDQVAAFLQVKRIEELRIESHRFEDYVGNLLNKALTQDVNLAKAVLLKAQELANKPQLGRSRSYYSRSVISDVLRHRSNRNENALAEVGLAVALIRDANDQGIVIGQYTFQNFGRLIHDAFRRNQSDGRPDEQTSLRSLYHDIGPLVGSRDASALLNPLAYCFERHAWDEKKIQAALNWSRTQMQEGKWPGLARLIHLQFLLYREARRAGSWRGADSPAKLPEIASTHYQNMLADQTLSVQWRLMALNMLLAKMGQASAPDLVMTGTDLLMAAWKAYPDVPSENYAGLLSRFLSVQQHPKWTRQARDLTRAYADYQQKVSRTGRRSYSTGTDLPLLEMNCLLDQEDRIKPQVLAGNGYLGQQLDSWAILLQYDKTSILAALVEKHWKQIQPQGYRAFPTARQAELPQILDRIVRDDLRYFAQVALSCLPDTQQRGGPRRRPDSDDTRNPRAERLVRLAQTFPEIDFQSQQLKQRTLYFLIEEGATLTVLEEALAQQAAQIDLKLLVNMRDRTFKQTQSQLLAAHCAGGILRGDPNSFVQTTRSLNSIASGMRNHEVDELRDVLRRRLTEVAQSTTRTWSKSQMAALAAAATELLLIKSDRMLYSGGELLPSHLVFHVLGEQEELLDQVYERIPASMRERLFRRVNLRELYDRLAIYVRDRNLSLNQRIAIVKRFHQIDVVKQRQQDDRRQDRNLLDRLRDCRIITSAEIQSHPKLVTELVGEDKRIRTFLEAARWEDLSLAGVSLDQHVLDLLNAPAAQDVELSLSLLAQAEAFSQAARQAGAWQGDMAEPAMSHLLNRKQVQSLVDVGIAAALGQDKQNAAWLLPPSYCSNVGSILYNLYGDLRAAHNDDKVEALEQLLQLLGPCFQQRKATGMAGCFVDLLGKHIQEDEAVLAQVLAWAKGKTESPDYGAVAQEIVVAAEFRRLTIKHGTRSDPNTRIQLPADHLIARHYQTFLNDGSVSVMWRLLALENLQWWKVVLEAPLLTPACQLMIQGLQQHEEVPEFLYAWIVRQFLGLATHDASWQQQAQALSQAYLNHVPPYRRIELSWSRRRASAGPLSTAMLRLHLQAGLPRAVETQIARDADLVGHPATWALLVEHQHADLFQSLAQDRINDVKITYGSQRGFTSIIEENLEACLQTLEPEGLRFAAEVLINALHDTGSDRAKPRIPRAQRLMSLARRFSSVEFSRPDLKHTVLVLLSRECAALAPISSILAKEAEALNLARLLNDSPEKSQILRGVVTAHYTDRLIKADAQGFVRGFSAILATVLPAQPTQVMSREPVTDPRTRQWLLQQMRSKIKDPQQLAEVERSIISGTKSQHRPRPERVSDSARAFWGQLSHGLNSAASYLAANWSRAQMAALAEAVRAYLHHVDMQRGVGFQPGMLNLHCASHLCAGHDAERINAEAEAFPGDVQGYYRRQIDDSDTLHTLCKELRRFLEDKNLSVDKRVTLVSTLLQLNQVQKASEEKGGRKAILALIQESKILTSDECAAHAHILLSQ